MIKSKKVYIKTTNEEFFGYTGFFEEPWRNVKESDDLVVVSENIYDELKNHLDSFLDNTFVPSFGDEIHVVPNCPIAIQEIRNNYKIKRETDAGVCNVFSPIQHMYGYWGFNSIVVCRELKTLMCVRHKYKTAYSAYNDFLESCPEIADYKDNIELYNFDNFDIYFSSRVNENYLKLYRGLLKKPCISYKKLKFQTNEMTADILYMVLKAGLQNRWGKDADKNFLVQLAVLNQHNWRDYSGTMHYLKHMLRYNGVYDYYDDHQSMLPKYAKEWYTTEFSAKFQSEKDFELCQEFVKICIGLGNKIFVDNKILNDKLSSSSLDLKMFDELYGMITKVVPRNYEDWKSKHSVC